MVQLAVTMKDGEWTVFKDGAVIEQGLSRSAAVERAEQIAFQAEEDGEDVELLIQGYTGEMTDRFSGGSRPGRRRG
jgi:hypothetical protein